MIEEIPTLFTKDTAMKVFSGSLSQNIHTVFVLGPFQYQSSPIQMGTATKGLKRALQNRSISA